MSGSGLNLDPRTQMVTPGVLLAQRLPFGRAGELLVAGDFLPRPLDLNGEVHNSRLTPLQNGEQRSTNRSPGERQQTVLPPSHPWGKPRTTLRPNQGYR